VAFMDHDQAVVGLFDRQGLSAIYTLTLPETPDHRQHQHFGQQVLPGILNRLKLSGHVSAPECVFLGSHDGADIPTLELSETLTSSPCRDFSSWLNTTAQTESCEPWKYTAAIGAAMEGLDAVPVRFDLLHSQKKQHASPYKFPWKVMIGLTVMALLASVILWSMRLHNKQKQLDDLQAQVAKTQPELFHLQQVQANWELARRYLPLSQDGTRQSYTKLLYEITRLFPDTEKAHVTGMTLTTGYQTPVTAGQYAINISGNVSEGDVLTGFIDLLNSSPMFGEAKRAGSLIQDADNPYYPFNFSVTCHLSTQEDKP
jgi:hypothetical protein